MLRTAARRLIARSFAPTLPMRAAPLRFFSQQPSAPSTVAENVDDEVEEVELNPVGLASEIAETVEANEEYEEDLAKEVDELLTNETKLEEFVAEHEEELNELNEEEDEWDVPGSVDSEGYFNEAPTFNPEPKMTRTSFAAFQLWEAAADEGMDLRLLGEMFNRLQITLKVDAMAETVFERVADPEQSQDEDLKRTVPLTAEQIKRCNRFKEEYLIVNLAPAMFSDLADLGVTREFEVFVKTVMGMVKNGKLKYLKQFSDEFTRFNYEGFNEIPVKVVTAFKLSEDQRELVTEWLESKMVLDATPVPTFRVNPKILGGVHIVWADQVEVMATIAPWFDRGLNNIKDGFDNPAPRENNIFVQ